MCSCCRCGCEQMLCVPAGVEQGGSPVGRGAALVGREGRGAGVLVL